MALRRLQAKTVLLAYPTENHTLHGYANRQDLTTRVLEWFDYFLKGEKDVDWITKGTYKL